MPNYKKILFPIDLSEAAAKISPHVKAMAEAFHAEVHLVYVAQSNEYYVEDEDEPGKSITEKVRQYKDKYCRDMGEPEIVVALEGEPDIEIISYAKQVGADMIIMATKGRSALGKALFGSVAANVIRHSSIPVFFVNPQQDKFLNRSC